MGQVRDKWRDFVSKLMNVRIPCNALYQLTWWGAVRFSSNTDILD
jgi:hypothetical protein